MRSSLISFRPAAWRGVSLLAVALATPAPALAQALAAPPERATGGAPLSVHEAMRLAAERAPLSQARDQGARTATAQAEAALALPDPKLRLGVDNLPFEGRDNPSFSRDFMTMRRIGVARDMPREAKRALRAERFRLEAQREAALRDEARLIARRDAALAWVERQHADHALELIDALAREARLQYDLLVGQVRTGRATPMEAVAAQGQLRALDDRRAEFARLSQRARLQLARWIGDAATRAPVAWRLADAGGLPGPAQVDAHPLLAGARVAAAQAANDVAQAKAQEQGDWSWEVAYQKRGDAFGDMLSFGVAIDLPALGRARIDPEVRAREAAVAAAEHEREEARVRLALETQLAINDWQSARARHAAFDATLLPLARERAEQALSAYRAGGARLGDVLEARRAQLETLLMQLQLELDAGRAWAQLRYFDIADLTGESR